MEKEGKSDPADLTGVAGNTLWQYKEVDTPATKVGEEIQPTIGETTELPARSIFDRSEDVPEYDFMRSLVYEAENWKRKKEPEFEARILGLLFNYLQEYKLDNGLVKGQLSPADLNFLNIKH